MSGADLFTKEGRCLPTSEGELLPLGRLRKGDRGVVAAIRDGLSHVADDLLTRILEMGFIEGAPVVLMHEGPIGRDPIAVLIRDTTVALRRREADAIMVQMIRG